MDIFVSWAGSDSHQVALVLRQWLPDVLRFVRPWVSSEDIRKGTRWSDELWGRLRNTSYSIVCVTREAVRSPWVNFEAGAVARAVGGQSHVSPLLLGMSAGDLGGIPALRAELLAGAGRSHVPVPLEEPAVVVALDEGPDHFSGLLERFEVVQIRCTPP